MCRKCGSLISPYLSKTRAEQSSSLATGIDDDSAQSPFWTCKTCESPENIVKVAIPFVLQYLVSELASVNIKVHFSAS